MNSSDTKHLRLPLKDLPDPLPVPTVRLPFDVEVLPPGSKSLTNRAILLASLADGVSTLRNPLLEADDARVMIRAVRQLGAAVEERDGSLEIRGVGGSWKPSSADRVALHLGNAGTATRFLTAASVLSQVPVVIDGDPRMRERPIGQLVEALRSLGASIDSLDRIGYPPLRIEGPAGGLTGGTTVSFGQTDSGQFISAMLMLGAFISGGLTIRLEGEITSPSYVRMTLSLLAQLGASVRESADLRIIRVAPPDATETGTAAESGCLQGFDLDIEPDASGGTYFWAAAAIVARSRCLVRGVGDGSLQGDAGFPELLSRIGCQIDHLDAGISCVGPSRPGPIMADLGGMPDATMTLASVLAFSRGQSVLRGVRTLRVKECDRLAALETELARIGVDVATGVLGDDDVMTIAPPSEMPIDAEDDPTPVEFDTYDDHRMAMSLALIGLRRRNVAIRDPGCVAKTYPSFWRQLADLVDASRGASG